MASAGGGGVSEFLPMLPFFLSSFLAIDLQHHDREGGACSRRGRCWSRDLGRWRRDRAAAPRGCREADRAPGCPTSEANWARRSGARPSGAGRFRATAGRPTRRCAAASSKRRPGSGAGERIQFSTVCRFDLRTRFQPNLRWKRPGQPRSGRDQGRRPDRVPLCRGWRERRRIGKRERRARPALAGGTRLAGRGVSGLSARMWPARGPTVRRRGRPGWRRGPWRRSRWGLRPDFGRRRSRESRTSRSRGRRFPGMSWPGAAPRGCRGRSPRFRRGPRRGPPFRPPWLHPLGFCRGTPAPARTGRRLHRRRSGPSRVQGRPAARIRRRLPPLRDCRLRHRTAERGRMRCRASRRRRRRRWPNGPPGARRRIPFRARLRRGRSRRMPPPPTWIVPRARAPEAAAGFPAGRRRGRARRVCLPAPAGRGQRPPLPPGRFPLRRPAMTLRRRFRGRAPPRPAAAAERPRPVLPRSGFR